MIAGLANDRRTQRLQVVAGSSARVVIPPRHSSFSSSLHVARGHHVVVRIRGRLVARRLCWRRTRHDSGSAAMPRLSPAAPAPRAAPRTARSPPFSWLPLPHFACGDSFARGFARRVGDESRSGSPAKSSSEWSPLDFAAPSGSSTSRLPGVSFSASSTSPSSADASGSASSDAGSSGSVGARTIRAPLLLQRERPRRVLLRTRASRRAPRPRPAPRRTPAPSDTAPTGFSRMARASTAAHLVGAIAERRAGERSHVVAQPDGRRPVSSSKAMAASEKTSAAVLHGCAGDPLGRAVRTAHRRAQPDAARARRRRRSRWRELRRA